MSAAHPGAPLAPGRPAPRLGHSRRAAATGSSEIRELLRLTERPGVRSLAGGLPDPTTFPTAELAEAAARVAGDPRALQYGATEGVAELREHLAGRETGRLGRPVTPDEVLVTTGSQQGLDLLARTLCDPGDVVLVDDPCYLGALQALRGAGARVVGVPVDDHGLRVDLVEDHLRSRTRPRLVYTVPTFQNPTGTTLARERRAALAALADRWGVPVVEDAPYEDLRFRGRPRPPVATGSDLVIGLGSASKTIAPGLRVGWVRAPAELVPALARAKQAVDLHTSTLAQHLVLDLLARPGWFDAHTRAVAADLGRREAALAAALAAELADRATWTRPDGGMFTWARLRPVADAGPRVDARAWLGAALDHDVAFVPGDAFAVDRPAGDAARLSFATVPADRMPDVARRLAAALSGRRRPTGGSGGRG